MSKRGREYEAVSVGRHSRRAVDGQIATNEKGEAVLGSGEKSLRRVNADKKLPAERGAVERIIRPVRL